MARIEVAICPALSASARATASVRRLVASASARAVLSAATMRRIDCDCSCEAAAASSAPLATCSIERASSRVAAADSVKPLASCSVAAAMRSETVWWTVSLRGGAGAFFAAGVFLRAVAAGAAVFAGAEASLDLLTRAM